MSRRLRNRLILAAVVAAAASGACVPLDDFMGDVFKRSMRDQRSFDPYENTLLPPEGSIPFAAGNYPPGPYAVNVGQPEGSADLPPPFTAEDMTEPARDRGRHRQPGRADRRVARSRQGGVRTGVRGVPRARRSGDDGVHLRGAPVDGRSSVEWRVGHDAQ